jgi:hypothetical protein
MRSNKALALERGAATPDDVTLAALLLIGGTLLTEGPRVLKRWWLITANGRIRAQFARRCPARDAVAAAR